MPTQKIFDSEFETRILPLEVDRLVGFALFRSRDFPEEKHIQNINQGSIKLFIYQMSCGCSYGHATAANSYRDTVELPCNRKHLSNIQMCPHCKPGFTDSGVWWLLPTESRTLHRFKRRCARLASKSHEHDRRVLYHSDSLRR